MDFNAAKLSYSIKISVNFRAILNTMNQTNSILSNKTEELIREFIKIDHQKDALLSWDDHQGPDSMVGYLYPVSYLPVVITKNCVSEFEVLCERAADILFRYIFRLFTEDRGTFKKFYGDHYQDLANQIHPEKDLENLMVRYDLLHSSETYKLLELNAGTNIGGWQVGMLFPLIMQNLSKFTDIRSWNLSHTDILQNMMSYLLQSALSHKGDCISGNIIISLKRSHIDEALADQIQTEFISLYDQLKPKSHPDSKLLFCFEPEEELIFDMDGTVSFQGLEVDAIAIVGLIDHPKDKLLASHSKGKVFYPNNTVSALMGDKMNFATIHWMAKNGLLNESDSDFVQRHLPWSANCAEDQVEWLGVKLTTEKFLLDYKDQLVIKKARSFQGKDVFIGKFSSDEEWLEAIAVARHEYGWLTQKFYDSDKVNFIGAEVNMVPHVPIWGIFGFRNKYAGSWARLSEITSEYNGVINCARGAKEAIVLQED